MNYRNWNKYTKLPPLHIISLECHPENAQKNRGKEGYQQILHLYCEYN